MLVEVCIEKKQDVIEVSVSRLDILHGKDIPKTPHLCRQFLTLEKEKDKLENLFGLEIQESCVRANYESLVDWPFTLTKEVIRLPENINHGLQLLNYFATLSVRRDLPTFYRFNQDDKIEMHIEERFPSNPFSWLSSIYKHKSFNKINRYLTISIDELQTTSNFDDKLFEKIKMAMMDLTKDMPNYQPLYQLLKLIEVCLSLSQENTEAQLTEIVETRNKQFIELIDDQLCKKNLATDELQTVLLDLVNKMNRRIYQRIIAIKIQSCIGKIAHDKKPYNSKYTEFPFLRWAEYRMGNDNKLHIINIKENNQYVSVYAPNHRLENTLEAELRHWGDIVGLTFEYEGDFEKEIIFTHESTQLFIDAGMLSLFELKRMILARNVQAFFSPTPLEQEGDKDSESEIPAAVSFFGKKATLAKEVQEIILEFAYPSIAGLLFKEKNNIRTLEFEQMSQKSKGTQPATLGL